MLETDPSVADQIEQIVVMGGAVSVAGNVEPDLSAEWNLHAHPAAARGRHQSGVPVSLVPLDATDHVPLTSEYIAGVGSIDNALAGVEAAALGTLAGPRRLVHVGRAGRGADRAARGGDVERALDRRRGRRVDRRVT